MNVLVLSRTPRPDGFTEIVVDLDGVRTATVQVPTVQAHRITDLELRAMIALGTGVVRARVR